MHKYLYVVETDVENSSYHTLKSIREEEKDDYWCLDDEDIFETLEDAKLEFKKRTEQSIDRLKERMKEALDSYEEEMYRVQFDATYTDEYKVCKWTSTIRKEKVLIADKDFLPYGCARTKEEVLKLIEEENEIRESYDGESVICAIEDLTGE